MIFVCFPLLGKKKELGHNHFYWIKFEVHERLSCSHVQALTITSCALRGVLRKRKAGEISENKGVFLTWMEKMCLFFVKHHKFAGRLASEIAFWAYATSEAQSLHLKKCTWSIHFDPSIHANRTLVFKLCNLFWS